MRNVRAATRLVTTVMVVVIAACNSTPSPVPSLPSAVLSPSQQPHDSASLGASQQPQATASSSPSAVDAPRQLGWIKIGQIGEGYGIDSLIAFDGGYLGLEVSLRPEGYPIVWYSPDGREWARSGITTTIRPCPGWVARTDGEITSAATNGRQVVLVGLEYAPDAEACRTWQAARMGEFGRHALSARATVFTLADQRRVLLRHQHRLQLEAINMAGAAGAARLDCPSGGRST